MLTIKFTISAFLTIALAFFCILARTAPLELVDSAPANNAVDVSRTENIILQFSLAVSAKSVNASSVVLQSPAGIQKAVVSVSGATVSVNPETSMLPWTVYTLSVNSSVLGINGEQLAAPISLSFTTRDASWQSSQTSDHFTSDQLNPTTSINAKGIRFVAWRQQNQALTGDDIWAIRRGPGTTSSIATRIASFSENHIEQLSVFVDQDGNAFVTWIVATPPFTQPRHIWANRFVAGSGAGSGWGVPQIIDGYSSRSGSNLHLAFDRAGNAFVLWQEYDCCATHSLQNIVASRYTKAGGWSKPVHLDTSVAFFAGKTDIKVDNVGDAYATWADFPNNYSATNTLIVSRYQSTANIGWSTRTLATETSLTTLGGRQVLGVNHYGDAFVMWTDDSGLKYSRNSGSNWDTPVLIDTSIKSPPSQLVLLDNGEAFAAFNVGVKQYLPEKNSWTWTHPLLPDQTASSDPRIVADSSGNALVAWTQNINGINRIYAKRYRANHGWFHPQLIDADSSSSDVLQELTLECDGSAIATWLRYEPDGAIDIQMSHFE